MSNPFTNCRVVASGVDPKWYHKTDEMRGSVNYPVSKSVLGEFAACPHRWWRGYHRPESKALTDGSLVDCLFLTPSRFDEQYAEVPSTYPDKKTGEAKDWNWNATYCKDWQDAQEGREPVKSEPLEEARASVSILHHDPIVAQIMDNPQTQVFVVGEYKDPATGIVVPVKALLDIVPDVRGRLGAFLFDFKRTRSAAMRSWTRDVFNFGYAIQAAFHGDLYRAATGEDRHTWGHIIQESVAPWHVEKRILSVEFVELGRGQYLSALALYCRCLATGVWPGYHADTVLEGFGLVQPEAWMVGSQDSRPVEPATADEPEQERFDILA